MLLDGALNNAWVYPMFDTKTHYVKDTSDLINVSYI